MDIAIGAGQARVKTVEHATTLKDMQSWRQQLLRGVLYASVIAGGLAVLIGGYSAYITHEIWRIPIYLGAYAVLLLVAFLRRVPLVLQGTTLLGVLYGLAILQLFSVGLAGSSLLYLLTLPVLAAILFGRREGRLALGLAIVTIAAFGWAFSTGRLAIPIERLLDITRPTAWITSATALLLLGTLLLASQNYLIPCVIQALTRSRELAREGELRAVAEERRREYLQAAVQSCVDYTAKVGRGNLSARLMLASPAGRDGDTGKDDDSLAALERGLNEMATSLHNMIVHIRESASALSAQSAEILATTTQQASGAAEQAAAVSQTTAIVDEIKTIAEQLVARSRAVADTAQRTVEVSHAGQGMVQEAITSMGQIKARVDVIEENILSLSERTQQIGEIIDTVSQIASQSNLLALNASVEAARAGEQGKGFAVVAQEVRDLAERSKQATAQVKAILSDIQKATASTAMATEEGKKGVDAGVGLVTQMRETIDQLAQVIAESAQSAMQMAAGGRQQMTGMEQIGHAMDDTNQVTVQSMVSTQQAEKSAQELNELARNLTELVEQYRV